MTAEKIEELRAYLESVSTQELTPYPEDIYGQCGGNFDDAYSDGREDGWDDGTRSLADSLLKRFFSENK